MLTSSWGLCWTVSAANDRKFLLTLRNVCRVSGLWTRPGECRCLQLCENSEQHLTPGLSLAPETWLKAKGLRTMTPAGDDFVDKLRRKSVNLSRLGKTNEIPAKDRTPYRRRMEPVAYHCYLSPQMCWEREAGSDLLGAPLRSRKIRASLFSRGFRFYNWPSDKEHLSPVDDAKVFPVAASPLLRSHR